MTKLSFSLTISRNASFCLCLTCYRLSLPLPLLYSWSCPSDMAMTAENEPEHNMASIGRSALLAANWWCRFEGPSSRWGDYR